MSTLFFIAVGFLTSIVGDRLFLLQTDVVAETIDTIISRGEKYYEERGDKENLLRAIEVLKEGKDSLKKESNAQSQDSSNNPRKEAKICSMLSKFYYKLAEYHNATLEKEREKLLKEAQRYGKEAVEKDPEDVGGYYWTAVSVGKWGSMHPLRFIGSKDRDVFEDMANEALKRDPSYDFGGPHRALAAYHMPQRLRMIRFWGDEEKALGHAQAAAEKSENYLWNHLTLARVLWQSGKKDEAVEKLKWISSRDDNILPEAHFENTHVKDKVKRYLKEYSDSGKIRW